MLGAGIWAAPSLSRSLDALLIAVLGTPRLADFLQLVLDRGAQSCPGIQPPTSNLRVAEQWAGGGPGRRAALVPPRRAQGRRGVARPAQRLRALKAPRRS